MEFKIQSKSCATCIYRKGHSWDIKKLEAEIADPRMKGHFAGYRICHCSDSACCAGFWARHKNKFDLGQLMQRLGLVKFVNDSHRKETDYEE